MDHNPYEYPGTGTYAKPGYVWYEYLDPRTWWGSKAVRQSPAYYDTNSIPYRGTKYPHHEIPEVKAKSSVASPVCLALLIMLLMIALTAAITLGILYVEQLRASDGGGGGVTPTVAIPTTTLPAQTGVPIRGNLTLPAWNWHQELTDATSLIYQAYQDKICAKLLEALQGPGQNVGCVITSFTQGSVISSYVVVVPEDGRTPEATRLATQNAISGVVATDDDLDSNQSVDTYVDFCVLDDGASPCDHFCLVEPGDNIVCSCRLGYVLAGDGSSCTDIDECEAGTSGCMGGCVNSDGSFECTCSGGYTLLADGTSCQDVDECQATNGGCSQLCGNNEGSFVCTCLNGYLLQADGLTCQDIDECEGVACDNGGTCDNQLGYFMCLCPAGFYGDRCQLRGDAAAFPCSENNGECDHLCDDVTGSVVCSCLTGYELGADETTCSDLDECATSKGGCAQTCHNVGGSFYCTCLDGYTLDADGLSCTDVLECETNTDDCSQSCINTPGSYDCGCLDGFTLDIDGITCSDTDECAGVANDCAQDCLNTPGSYTCGCLDGFLLNPDGRTCTDIDECSQRPPLCSSGCDNTDGSFTCTCPDDQVLGPDLRTCYAFSVAMVPAPIRLLRVGEEAEYSCYMENGPPAGSDVTLQWLRNDQPVSDDILDRVWATETVWNDQPASMLHITSVSTLDAGSYTCAATYRGMQVTSEILLEVNPCTGRDHYCDDACLTFENVCDGRLHCTDFTDEMGCECNQADQPWSPFTSSTYNLKAQCTMGLCIPLGHWCDGTIHCPDASDEYPGCTKACPEDFLQCQDVTGDVISCFPPEMTCDFNAYCNNGDKGAICDCSGEIRCDNGGCVEPQYWCDGDNNCGDWSDEHCSECDEGLRRCDNGQCMASRYFCDGYLVSLDGGFGCADGSDEEHCDSCQGSQAVKCDTTTRCTQLGRVCDGVNDCGDWSDEADCSCYPNEQQCGTGPCIPSDLWCDSKNDCGDWSDEADCVCEADHFECTDGKVCLSDRLFCNGHVDCPDGSDEYDGCGSDCPDELFSCSGRCFHSDMSCDGTVQCPDYSDEQDCVCVPGTFPCSQGGCVPETAWCNGVYDCFDLSDEGPACSTSCPPGYYGCGDPAGCYHPVDMCGGLVSCPGVLSAEDCDTLGFPESSCGVPTYAPSGLSTFIFGGEEARPFSHPWTVSLRNIRSAGTFDIHVCGAVIVGESWVLTAARCVYTYRNTPEALKIVAGNHDNTKLESSEYEYDIKHVMIHPSFDLLTLDVDLALLQTTEDMTFNREVKPVCLTEDDFPDATLCVITGWGETIVCTNDFYDDGLCALWASSGECDNNPSWMWTWCYRACSECDPTVLHTSKENVLNQATTPIIPQATCATWYSHLNITDNMMCAGSEAGLSGPCKGDTGSPLVCERDGIYILQGISSFFRDEKFCAQPRSPAVFTRTSQFAAWVDRKMGVCAPDATLCLNSASCVLPGEICDGFNDCVDGWDESACDCASGKIKCREPMKLFFKCVSTEQVCIGRLECEEMEGELDCAGAQPVCGVPVIPPRVVSQLVYAGQEAVPNSWPWLASLQSDNGDGTYGHRCGGVVLSDRWVLTAAHCVNSLTVYPGSIRVVLGSHRNAVVDPEERWYNVDRVVLHPGYNISTIDLDIGLVHIDETIQFTKAIQPACLAEHDFAAGKLCVVAGWGHSHVCYNIEREGVCNLWASIGECYANSEWMWKNCFKSCSGCDPNKINTGTPTVGGASAAVNQAFIPIVDRQQCGEWHARRSGVVTENMVCAGSRDVKSGGCVGDSGGPLVCLEGDVYYVQGVTSWLGFIRPDFCALTYNPNVFADVVPVRDWINRRIGVCEEGTIPCNNTEGCVALSEVCDGISDCADQEDEKNCDCGSDQRKCDNDICVDEVNWCEGINHCGDWSDESNCGECRSMQFRCDNGVCRSTVAYCNGIEECPDGSDEKPGCSTSKDCPTGMFACNCTVCQGGCYPNEYLCDGYNDCDDLEDENCVIKTTVEPMSTVPPVTSYTLCEVDELYAREGVIQTPGFPSPYPTDQDCRLLIYTDTPPGDVDILAFNFSLFVTEENFDILSIAGDGASGVSLSGDQVPLNTNFIVTTRHGVFTVRFLSDPSVTLTGFSLNYEVMAPDACPTDYVKCNSTQPGIRMCLALDQLCDGSLDCPDAEDEANCVCSQGQCGDGLCFDYSVACDGQCDCADGSDEANCVEPCEDYMFACGDGQCISLGLTCDGKVNCRNSMDETTCNDQCNNLERVTPDGQPVQDVFFLYTLTQLRRFNTSCTNGACVQARRWCDGVVDCLDNSDEEAGCSRGCPPGFFVCGSGDCVHPGVQCDGFPDCDDHSDETSCSCPPRDEVREPIELLLFVSNTTWSQCATGLCLPQLFFCDGWPHCLDRSDEACDGPPPGPCSDPSERLCDDGQCINSTWFCDAEKDCDDASDERDCDCTLPLRQTCSNGICLHDQYFCNGVDDCGDGSDEVGCPCIDGQFDCGDKCIPIVNVCDSANDCGDWTDEMACPCPAERYQCADSTVCQHKSTWCDGSIDCPDGSDELPGCDGSCLSGQHSCDGKCVPAEGLCDGKVDCLDWSDEANCACTGESFRCADDSVCAPVDKWCDGVQHCRDFSDEVPGCCGTCPAGFVYCVSSKRCMSLSIACHEPDSCLEWDASAPIVCDGVNNPPITCGVPVIKPYRSPSGPATYIVGGAESRENSWPWQANIRLRAAGWRRICGAILVSGKWLITAAHCVTPELGDKADFRIQLGHHDLNEYEPFGQEFNVKEIISHPRYLDSDFDWDLALIEIEGTVTFTSQVSPICLPSEEFPAGHSCIITGWGLTKGTGDDTLLNQADVPIVDQAECARIYSTRGATITPNNICVGGEDQGACQGDSGGPLVCARGGRYQLVGGTSFGPSICNTRNTPSVYSRITSFMDFITNNTGLRPQEVLPPPPSG